MVFFVNNDINPWSYQNKQRWSYPSEDSHHTVDYGQADQPAVVVDDGDAIRVRLGLIATVIM